MFRRTASILSGRAEAASPPPGYYESTSGLPIPEVEQPHDDVVQADGEAIHERPLPPVPAPLPSSTSSAPSVAPPPFVMRWQPEYVHPPGRSRRNSSTSVDTNTVHQLEPPVTITYSFSQTGTNTMVLLPQASHRDTRPLYYVSWREDYFLPNNFITTIRRGGSEHGQFVAEFNLKQNQKGASVRMGSGNEKWLSEVLSPRTGKVAKWKYDDDAPLLFWLDRKSSVMNCTLNTMTNEVIARFASPGYNTQNFATQVAKLELRPAAQLADICDHVMLSALIIERLRVVERSQQHYD